jgi:PAS domain S-box-containing protein
VGRAAAAGRLGRPAPGTRGGAVAAAAAAALPLLAAGSAPPAAFLQAQLLALCGAGLLTAAAADRVRRRDARYRRVVAHVPVVVCSARLPADGDPDAAEVTLVSAAAGRLLGRHPEQLLGPYTRWLEAVHPDDREVVRAAVRQLSRQPQPVACEYRILDAGADGKAVGDAPPAPRPAALRYVRDVMAPRRDAAGRLTGWEGVVTDVTEQRVLADDLRRTTAMLRALVDNLPAGVVFVQGPHGRPVLVNARARQLLGRREDPAAGVERLPDAYRLHRPDGAPYPAEELPVFQALRQGVAARRDDVVVHRPDGRRTALVSWAAPVDLGGPGGADAAVWVLEDWTALRQAEAARSDTEGRFRTVVETMGEALLVVDRAGAVVDCNPAACAAFGRTPEQLRGRSRRDWPGDFVREDGTPLPDDDVPVRRALCTGRPVRNAVFGLRPPGGGPAVRWFRVNAVPLGGPEPAGVVATFADATAEHAAREALRASEEKYRGLVESLPVMVVHADRAQRLLYTNPAVRAVTGFELEEIADPAAWAARVHPDDLPRVRAWAEEALGGRPGRVEFRFRSKNGAERTTLALSQPTWRGGRWTASCRSWWT